MTDLVLRFGSLLASGKSNKRSYPARLLVVRIKMTPEFPDILGATVRSAPATPSIDQFKPFLASMCFIEDHHRYGDPFNVATIRIDLIQQRGDFLKLFMPTLIYAFHVLLLE